MAKPITKPMELAAVKTRTRKSFSGITGSAAARSAASEADRQHDAEHRGGDARDGDPRPRDPAQTEEEDERRRRTGEEDGPRVVDGVVHPAQMARQHGAGHEQGEDPERQVDVEDPAPRQVRHTEPADERPDHGGHGEHGPEEAHVAAAVARATRRRR